MKILIWTTKMKDKETATVGYWERNVLALRYADGWYYDDVPAEWTKEQLDFADKAAVVLSGTIPRMTGWRRVLSLDSGQITFHIPDDFDVGELKQIFPNWDGHTTEEKWARVLAMRGVKVD